MKFLLKKCLFLCHYGHFEVGVGNQSCTSHESTTVIHVFDICDELSCMPTANANYSNNSKKNNTGENPYVLLPQFMARLLK